MSHRDPYCPCLDERESPCAGYRRRSLSIGQFLSAQSRSVQGHQNHAMASRLLADSISRADFFLAQNHRQSLRRFRIDQIDLTVGSAKHLDEEEPQRGDPCRPIVFGVSFAIVEQMQLILPQMFLAEMVGTLAEVAGEIFDARTDSVGSCLESSYDAGVLPASAFVVGSCEPPFEAHNFTGRLITSSVSPRVASAAPAASFKSPRVYQLATTSQANGRITG